MKVKFERKIWQQRNVVAVCRPDKQSRTRLLIWIPQ